MICNQTTFNNSYVFGPPFVYYPVNYAQQTPIQPADQRYVLIQPVFAPIQVNHYLPPMVAVPSPPKPQAMCIELKCQDIIGVGGFGVVWKICDPRTRQWAAVKKIGPVFHPDNFQSNLREIQFMTTLNHENILSAQDLLLPADRNNFIEIFVMSELMDLTLLNIIVHGSMPLLQIQTYLYQILRGVHYLHANNVMHLDLKPENIMVTNHRLKICDFGLARKWDVRDRTPISVFGTCGYAAPEVAMNFGRYSGAADMWSIGCILAEMFKREMLFSAKSSEKQLLETVSFLGSPPDTDIMAAEPKMLQFMRAIPHVRQDAMKFFLTPETTLSAANLLQKLLQFNPNNRITAAMAFTDEFVKVGQQNFHSHLCSCCFPNQQTTIPEPAPMVHLKRGWADSFNLANIAHCRSRVYEFISSFKRPVVPLVAFHDPVETLSSHLFNRR